MFFSVCMCKEVSTNVDKQVCSCTHEWLAVFVYCCQCFFMLCFCLWYVCVCVCVLCSVYALWLDSQNKLTCVKTLNYSRSTGIAASVETHCVTIHSYYGTVCGFLVSHASIWPYIWVHVQCVADPAAWRFVYNIFLIYGELGVAVSGPRVKIHTALAVISQLSVSFRIPITLFPELVLFILYADMLSQCQNNDIIN